MRKLPLLALLVASCQPTADGLAGPPGPQGEQGPPGAMGTLGTPGRDAQGSNDKNGTRLQVRRSRVVFASEDGGRLEGGIAASWFDPAFNTRCAMSPAEDRAMRCMPPSNSMSR